MRQPITAAGLGLIIVAACSAEQPRPVCSARRSAFAAKYTLVSMTGMCDMRLRASEELEVQSYVPDPTKPEDPFGSMAIEPKVVGDAVAAGEGLMPPVVDPKLSEYSLGKFTTVRPDDGGLCYVPAMNETKVTLPALPDNKGDAVDLRYQFKNVRIIVTPPSNGLHFGADLTLADSGCTAVYRVSAVAPAVPCGDNKDDPTMGKPDDSLCIPEPDLAKGYAGSGISPDIAVACDKDLLECVPKKDFPSLK